MVMGAAEIHSVTNGLYKFRSRTSDPPTKIARRPELIIITLPFPIDWFTLIALDRRKGLLQRCFRTDQVSRIHT